MANPRYQQRRNPREERLAQLAMLAQIYSGLQAPQMRQQENQQQNALGVLGLILSQQGRQDALRQDQSQFEATQQGRATQGEETMKMKALEMILNDPSTSPQEKQAAMTTMLPSMAPVGEAMGQARLQTNVAKRTPELQAGYQTHANDPKKLNEFIKAFQATTPPDEFNNQPWDVLNQGLPAPQPEGPGLLDRIFGGGGGTTAAAQPAAPVAAQPYSVFESPEVTLARRQQEQQTGIRLTPEVLAQQKLDAANRAKLKLLQQYGITQ